MKKSDLNLAVIENFILHITHSSDDESDEYFNETITVTPKQLYEMAREYIEEDHVDGKDNEEDHIVTFGAESSFENDDKNQEYDEHVVIVGDFGEEIGTKTICSLSVNQTAENLVEAINDLIDIVKDPYKTL